jgi:hypothetical protein
MGHGFSMSRPMSRSMSASAGFRGSGGGRGGFPPPRTGFNRRPNQGFRNRPAFAGNNFFPGSGVPGLGGLGLGSNLGIEALIDPRTQAELALAGRFRRYSPYFGYGGYGGAFYSAPTGYYDPGPGAANAYADPEPDANSAEDPSESQESAANENVSAPLPDVGDFVLVTKEGDQIAAGAFYHQGNSLVYVTPSGARRSVPFSDLDRDSTVLINQERGTDLQSLL